MLSLFYVLLFLAAGSNASPCSMSGGSASGSPTSSSSAPSSFNSSVSGAAAALNGGSNNLAALGGANPSVTSNVGSTASTTSTPGLNSAQGQGGNLVLPLQYSQGSNLGTASTTGGGAAVQSGAASSSGSCPPGFLNTVFNTNAPKNGGWPSTTWSSLANNGVNHWIGFALGTLDTKSTYGNPPVTPELNSAQIHVVMDPTDVTAGLTMVQGVNPPTHLELFNEPDFSFEGFTPLTDPITAAAKLSQFFSIPHPATTYISPALMDANGPWLPSFKSSCHGCFDQIPIIAMHVYDPTPQGVMGQITQLHSTWPDKKIWITELSPATSGCSMDANGIAGYMNTLIPQIVALGYVEKIFWNSGEWDSPAINGAPNSCNPALTDANGNPTPVLTAYKNVCGGSGSTATS